MSQDVFQHFFDTSYGFDHDTATEEQLMAMLDEYEGDFERFGMDGKTALTEIRTFFDIVYSELMDESNHITKASGFATREDENGNVVVMKTTAGSDGAEQVVETAYPVDSTKIHKVNPDNADILEAFCTAGELEELSKIGHIIIGLEKSGACPIIGQSASGYASSLAVVDNAMYEWDLAGQPAEIAEHQDTQWGDMWDESYFNMDYTNDQGQTEQMIADGTD